jgi:DNA polymerase-3 subunit beta
MKLTADSGELAAAVKFAARILEARIMIPAWAGLKITAADGAVALAATAPESTARAALAAGTGEPGEILVPGRMLADITARLPRRHPADLAADEHALTITCGNLRYRVPLMPVADYPAHAPLPEPAGHADAAEFTAAVTRTAGAAARDDTLPMLSAVHLEFTPDTIALTATDRYRAAFTRLPWTPAGDGPLPPPVLVPARDLAGAARDASGGQVSVGFTPGEDGIPAAVALGYGGDRTLTVVLTQGEYVNIAAKIPADFTTAAVVDADETAEAVKRLTVVASGDFPVHLAFSDGQAELTAGSPGEAEARDTVACDVDGEPVSVAFHPARLLDALAPFSGGRARIGMTGDSKPVLFTPAGDAGGQGEDPVPACRHLLAPIRNAG